MSHAPYDWESRPATNRALDEDEADAFRVLMDAVAAWDGATLLGQTDWIRENESERATALTHALTHHVRGLGAALAEVVMGNRAAVAELDQLRDAAAATTESLRAALPDDPGAEDAQLEARLVKLRRRSLTKEQRAVVRAARQRRVPLMKICPDHLRLERAAAVLRAAALEAHDVNLEVSSQNTTFTAKWTELTTDAADAELADLLLFEVERHDAHVATHAFERGAAEWWFRCYTPRWPTDSGAPKAASMEWVLLDRTMLMLGDTPLAAFSRTPAFQALGPRMQRLRAGFEQSHVGLYLVQPSWGNDVVLEEVTINGDGDRYHVCRRQHEDEWESGDLAVGRLIPNGDGRHLPSRAMLTVDPSTTGKDIEHWRLRFDTLCATLPCAIAAEALLSEMLKPKDRVPRRGPVAWFPGQPRWAWSEIERILDARLPSAPPGHPNATTLRRAGRVVDDPSIRAFRAASPHGRDYYWSAVSFDRPAGRGNAAHTTDLPKRWLPTIDLMAVSSLLSAFGGALAGMASRAEIDLGNDVLAATMFVVGALIYTWARTGKELEDRDVPPGPAVRRGILLGAAAAIGLGAQTWLSGAPWPGDSTALDIHSPSFAMTLVVAAALATVIVSLYAKDTWPPPPIRLEDQKPWPPAAEAAMPVRWLGGGWSIAPATGIALRGGFAMAGAIVLGAAPVMVIGTPMIMTLFVVGGAVAICAAIWGDVARALAVLELSDGETLRIGASIGVVIGLCMAVTPLVIRLARAGWSPEFVDFHPLRFVALVLVPTVIAALSLVTDTWDAARRRRRIASAEDL